MDCKPKLGHFLLNRVFYYIIAVIAGLTIVVIVGVLGGADLFLSINERVLDLIFHVTLYSAYYLFLEASTQGSVAKLILKRVVVDEYGDKPTFK